MGMLKKLSGKSKAPSHHPTDGGPTAHGTLAPVPRVKKVVFVAFVGCMVLLTALLSLQAPQNPPAENLPPIEDTPGSPEPPELQESPYLYENTTQLKCHFPRGSGLWWWDPIVIENQVFAGTYSTSSLRLAHIPVHVIVRNCTFYNQDKIAIYEEYGIEIVNSPKVRVENCTFFEVENGILVQNTIGAEAGINITASQFISPDDHAITIINAANVSITNNMIEAALGAIRLEGAHNVSIASNAISGCPVVIYSIGDNNNIYVYWNYLSANSQILFAKTALKAAGFSFAHPIHGHGNFYAQYSAITPNFSLSIPSGVEGIVMPRLLSPVSAIWAADMPYMLEFGYSDAMPLIALTGEAFTWAITGIQDGDAFGPIAPSMTVSFQTLVPATLNYTINGILGGETFSSTITNGGQAWTTQLNQTIWGSLPSGSVEISVYIATILGRTYSATVSVEVDLEGPTIAILDPLSNTLYGYTPPTLEITIGDASEIVAMGYELGVGGIYGDPIAITGFNPAFSCQIDQSHWNALANDSVITIRLTASDEWGNTAQQSIAVRKILTPPSVQILTPASLHYVNSELPYHIILHDSAPANIQYRFNGGSWTNLAYTEGTLLTSGLAEGMHLLTFRGFDAYGTFNTTSIEFCVDRTAPELSLLYPTADAAKLTPHTISQAPTIVIGISDTSPVTITYTIAGTTFILDSTAPPAKYSTSGVLDQTAWEALIEEAVANGQSNTSIAFTATDAAGNIAVIEIEFQLPITEGEKPAYYAWLNKISLSHLILGIVVIALGFSIASYVRSGRANPHRAASDVSKKGISQPPKRSKLTSKLARGHAV